MSRNRFSQIRWGEALAFLTMLIVGIVIFVLQLLTWAIPQLTLYQEFVPSRGIVLDKRIAEQTFGTEVRYRPEVLLEHTVEGKNYRVWTFDYHTLQPKEGFTIHQELAESALEPFVVGRRTNCWYRVYYPEQAIVVWQISIWGWFLLLLSFSLIVLGLVGLPQSVRLLAVSKERQIAVQTLPKPHTSAWATIPDIRGINESPGTHLSYRLPLGHRPIFPLIGQTIFAAAWTVIALVILIQSFFDTAGNWMDQLLKILFRGLFCGVGIALYWAVAQQLWATFRVAPTLLEISDHPICPNRKYRVLLHQDGALQFQHLTVDLVCEEIARFHQGTDTVTNRLDVFRQTIPIRFQDNTGNTVARRVLSASSRGSHAFFPSTKQRSGLEIGIYGTVGRLVGTPARLSDRRSSRIVQRPHHGRERIVIKGGVHHSSNENDAPDCITCITKSPSGRLTEDRSGNDC